MDFIDKYTEAVTTSLGLFWMALWAFILGYIVSGIIQVFVGKNQMRSKMRSGSKSIALGTFFGFISSSCSFSALATTKSLFKKGAGFMPSLAFLLASTNLVIELGLLIYVFLDWQFVAAEYIGGVLLILITWVVFTFTKPKELLHKVRSRFKDEEGDHSHHHEKPKFNSLQSWKQVSQKFFMEWQMVWKDVTVGFTVAGIISAFVPQSFFETLFINTASNSDYSFLTLLEHSVVGPIAAFFTFIGSMGNIPLAAVLYQNGVSFAGVMAFIFSDLVVFPVLRINAKYYGWKMSFYILFLLLVALVISAISLHYGFSWFDALPEAVDKKQTSQDFFKLNYTFYLNLLFLAITALFSYWKFFKNSDKKHHHHEMASKGKFEKVLKILAILAYLWLGVGLLVKLFS
jgi:hypothetical protein